MTRRRARVWTLLALGAITLLGAATGLALSERGGVRRPVLVRVPPAETTSTTARFAYRASGARLTFACALDGRRYRRCGPRRRTYANLRVGRHRFCVIARRGRTRSAPTCHSWTILPPGSAAPDTGADGGPTPPAGDPRSFRIEGTATAPLHPGGPAVPVDLVFANPHAAPITIASVTMRIAGARPSGCAEAIAVADQLAATPSIPGESTRALSELGVPPRSWPHLTMADTGTNQNACAGATILLRFAGRATG